MRFTAFLYFEREDGEEEEVEVEGLAAARSWTKEYGSEGPYGSTWAVQFPGGIDVPEEVEIEDGEVAEKAGGRRWTLASLDERNRERLYEAAFDAVSEEGPDDVDFDG